jgi:hypothetical protein
MPGSLKTAASEFAKYNFNLVTVQEVRGVEGEVSQQMIIHFSMAMEMLLSLMDRPFHISGKQISS